MTAIIAATVSPAAKVSSSENEEAAFKVKITGQNFKVRPDGCLLVVEGQNAVAANTHLVALIGRHAGQQLRREAHPSAPAPCEGIRLARTAAVQPPAKRTARGRMRGRSGTQGAVRVLCGFQNPFSTSGPNHPRFSAFASPPCGLSPSSRATDRSEVTRPSHHATRAWPRKRK